MRTTLPLLATCAILIAWAGYARGVDDQAESGYVPLHRYLVTTSHTPDQCLAALDEMAARKKSTLGKMEWGCRAGDHTGYLVVESSDADTVLQMLPEGSRSSAKVVELTRFTPRQLRAIHARREQQAGGGAKPAAR